MKQIGFNFTKIIAEKKGNFNVEKIKITPTLTVLDIKETKADVLKIKESILVISFKYILNYEENVANIEFEGNIILTLDSAKLKEVLSQWKDKKLDPNFKIDIFNIIMRKSNVKALQLEEDLGIPYHFQMPFIKKEK